MSDCTPDALVQAAACLKCIPSGMQLPVQTKLLCEIRDKTQVIETAIAPGWDDLRFPVSSLNPTGLPSPGTLRFNSGQPLGAGTQEALELTTNNTLYVTVQMDHMWVGGTRIYPHIHIQPQLNIQNVVTLDLRYQIAEPNGVFPASTLVSTGFTIPAGSQWKHLLYRLPDAGIDMSAYTEPSTVIRFYYLVTAVTNVFHVISFDVHYLKQAQPVPFDPQD